jgi:predicted ATPase
LRQIADVFPNVLTAKREQRVTLLKEIHCVLLEIVGVYEEFYKPVQEFIEKHPVAAEQGSLNFSAKVALATNFAERFLGSLDRSKRGSFQGKEEGERKLKEEALSADFKTAEGATSFANRLEELLKTDEGDAGKPQRDIKSQLRSSVTEDEVLSYIYGLEYLEPRYELTWQGKSLEQLSPGERGNLLIVFYLLIDKRTCPLVIDQPEENLDNQTIAKMLVPCLKYAKGRRQVFVVTHNPNLAVVADADQVIHAEIDKAGGNRISYTTGSIEEPIINRKIVDFLEGTKPAFDLRDAKYELFP